MPKSSSARSIVTNGESERLLGRHWRTPDAHVIGHVVAGRRTILVIPRDRWRSVDVMDSAILGAGFEAAVQTRVDRTFRDEVLAWLDRPTERA